ncbi:s-methyl-5-thioribose-1-phosphate isomerase [Oscillospiraceae bacterium OttesenSCG-928-G22]|nr:s-methyl-5-thioribose-1-phosphate isomerase [Oscillospiraceae bacterium OttesenSCG-928-G22]
MIRADEGLAFLLRYENIAWYEGGSVRILDRRVYPMKTEFVTCRSHADVAAAIRDMVTQSGGPYTAAAMGMALAAHECRDKSEAEKRRYLEAAAHTLSHARPTTVSKMEAVTARALRAAERAMAEGGDVSAAIFEGALADLNEKYRRHEAAGRVLAAKIPRGGTVMTQCFGETIVGMLLRACREAGNDISVICPETRPYYQGARLTASCVRDMGFPVTVITDNMPGYVLAKKNVDLFTSAADVICMDGHIVNKIGTFQIALAAHYHGIPYFVTGTPQRAHPDMSSVTIEERDPAQTTESLGQTTVMEGVSGYYPAFDITPPHLCAGVVTDRGMFSPFDLPSYYTDGGEEELAP